jgi:uncharacterized protein (DUF2267 family)
MTPQNPEPSTKEADPLAEASAVAQDWIADLMQRLQWRHHDIAYHALFACLHALRDSLPKDEAVYLGLAMPALIRGVYFEGWRPTGRAIGARTRQAFLDRIHEGVGRDPAVDAEQLARTVFALLVERLPSSEIENAKAVTPAALHALWP